MYNTRNIKTRSLAAVGKSYYVYDHVNEKVVRRILESIEIVNSVVTFHLNDIDSFKLYKSKGECMKAHIEING